jgi:hypothetical protein
MTVYTNALLEDFYEDEVFVSAFTGDDTSETVIIADDDEPPPPPVPAFFGFLRLALWQ